MNHVFIVNPHAGKGNTREDILKQAQKAGIDATVYMTTGKNDGMSFVSSWCKSHPTEKTRFYACGGDGTLNEVINGAAGYENVSVYPYPCGSGNDFVKYYGKAEDFLNPASFNSAKEISVDLIKANGKYAVNVVNFGFDAAVCHTMEKVRHKFLLGGKNSYTTGIITALFKNMKNKCSVYADGELINSENILLCTAANGRYVGGKYLCAPNSDNTDGLMEICLANPISRLSFIRLIRYYKSGTHLQPRFKNVITYRRSKSLKVEAENDNFSYCLDGEIHYGKSLEIDIVAKGITLAVPEKLIPEKTENKKLVEV